jgi:hypothetical protein
MGKTTKERNDTQRYTGAFWKGWISTFNPAVLLLDLPDFEGGVERDREAIAGDWRAVGDDMRRAMGIVINEG